MNKSIKEFIKESNRIRDAIQAYADQECIRFAKWIQTIPIDIRAKYKIERLYQAYKNKEILQ